jgi:23S rRNA (cytosine1962-C5)-methyltransferase/23S rRNA (guanine2445-N2)-methyltransferase / 23S rRNA (guanine2069-N7)-methyltransferase
MDMIKNRIEKNYKKLKSWSDRNKIEAFRLYDRDIPEYPFIVDIYKDHFVVYDKSDFILDKEKNHLPHVVDALIYIFNCDEDKIVIKRRERQEGVKQYEKLDAKEETFVVRESQALFKVNLYDYLDTGLFLDHRPMRHKIFQISKNKKVLNLFCYTGSVSVFAALGGGKVTSVDMSQTYLRWAQDNFELNKINLAEHSFVNANVVEWLGETHFTQEFDVIFLDPPTFSNSKKMSESFDVERDQLQLVTNCMQMLRPDGVLYFSNNKRKFKLAPEIQSQYKVTDISEATIPQDFHDKKIHNCFEIKNI